MRTWIIVGIFLLNALTLFSQNKDSCVRTIYTTYVPPPKMTPTSIDTNGVCYPTSNFNINCTGDSCAVRVKLVNDRISVNYDPHDRRYKVEYGLVEYYTTSGKCIEQAVLITEHTFYNYKPRAQFYISTGPAKTYLISKKLYGLTVLNTDKFYLFIPTKDYQY